MIYLLAGIVVICALLCISELIVRMWEKLEQPKAAFIEIQTRKDQAA